MRIYVVNGRKALKFIKLISVILLLAIGICTISDILERKFVSASSEANVGKVIIIDAGHGGPLIFIWPRRSTDRPRISREPRGQRATVPHARLR